MTITLVVLVGSGLAGQDLSLKDFVFAIEELPKGCKPKQIESGSSLPCGISSNPFVSSDRSFLDCFAEGFVRDSILLGKVKSGLFSVYESPTEMGIFGFEFDSEETAGKVLKRMKEANPNETGFEPIQIERVILLLWKDGGENSSFNELKKLIDARTE